MEWQIKTIARKSARSEQVFTPGDKVACIIFKEAAGGEVGRVDMLLDEIDGYQPEGEILGRWQREVKHPDEASTNSKANVASAEDFFFSLYENDANASDETANALKHLLALMLERKRVLRAIPPRQTDGNQPYLHVKLKKEILVPILPISPELMLRIQDTIGDIIL